MFSRNELTGVFYTLVFFGLLTAGVCLVIFEVAIPIMHQLAAQGVAPAGALLAGTGVTILLIFFAAWKVYLPYLNWLEPRLRGEKPWR